MPIQEDNKEKLTREITGTVESTKMDKTIIVSVQRLVWHKRYKKQYKQTTTFKVHDEKGVARGGNIVLFRECKPMSKEKKWRLIKVLKERI